MNNSKIIVISIFHSFDSYTLRLTWIFSRSTCRAIVSASLQVSASIWPAVDTERWNDRYLFLDRQSPISISFQDTSFNILKQSHQFMIHKFSLRLLSSTLYLHTHWPQWKSTTLCYLQKPSVETRVHGENECVSVSSTIYYRFNWGGMGFSSIDSFLFLIHSDRHSVKFNFHKKNLCMLLYICFISPVRMHSRMLGSLITNV